MCFFRVIHWFPCYAYVLSISTSLFCIQFSRCIHIKLGFLISLRFDLLPVYFFLFTPNHFFLFSLDLQLAMCFLILFCDTVRLLFLILVVYICPLLDFSNVSTITTSHYFHLSLTVLSQHSLSFISNHFISLRWEYVERFQTKKSCNLESQNLVCSCNLYVIKSPMMKNKRSNQNSQK